MKKKISFQYNGQTYNVDVERSGNDLKINREGKSYSVTLLEEAKPKTAAPAPRPVTPAPLAAPIRTAAPAAAASARGDIPAPMTGTVKEVKVSKGDSVTKGQLVIVMEAMKMDIEVFASSGGTIGDVFVNPGDAVKENQRLLQIQ